MGFWELKEVKTEIKFIFPISYFVQFLAPRGEMMSLITALEKSFTDHNAVIKLIKLGN